MKKIYILTFFLVLGLIFCSYNTSPVAEDMQPQIFSEPSEFMEASKSDTPLESEEPAANEAENIEPDDGRLLRLPEGAVTLTEEELAEIRDQWFGWDTEGAPFQFANAFLTCFYESPEEIDLFCVFHNGMDSNARNISNRERELLKDHLPFPEMEVHKTAVSDMDDALLAYAGLGLQDIDRIGLDAFAYLEESDAYYLVCSDTMWTYHDFPEGYYAPDGSLVLLCQDRLSSPAPLMVLTLRPTDSENNFHGYHFYSNQSYEE